MSLGRFLSRAEPLVQAPYGQPQKGCQGGDENGRTGESSSLEAVTPGFVSGRDEALRLILLECLALANVLKSVEKISRRIG